MPMRKWLIHLVYRKGEIVFLDFVWANSLKEAAKTAHDKICELHGEMKPGVIEGVEWDDWIKRGCHLDTEEEK